MLFVCWKRTHEEEVLCGNELGETFSVDCKGTFSEGSIKFNPDPLWRSALLYRSQEGKVLLRRSGRGWHSSVLPNSPEGCESHGHAPCPKRLVISSWEWVCSLCHEKQGSHLKAWIHASYLSLRGFFSAEGEYFWSQLFRKSSSCNRALLREHLVVLVIRRAIVF